MSKDGGCRVAGREHFRFGGFGPSLSAPECKPIVQYAVLRARIDNEDGLTCSDVRGDLLALHMVMLSITHGDIGPASLQKAEPACRRQAKGAWEGHGQKNEGLPNVWHGSHKVLSQK